MNRSFARLSTAFAATLLIALPALAERPSVNSLNTELNRTRAAICAKADADGDSYRPFVCEARCDCIEEETFPKLQSCDETSPGTFVASGSQTLSSHVCEDQFSGGGSCVAFPAGFSGPNYCNGSSGQGCTSNANCQAGETCEAVAADTNGDGVPDQVAGLCLQTCSSSAQCTGQFLFRGCVLPQTCSATSDCPSGWGCVDSFCVQPCASGQETCDVVQTTAVAISGVGGPDSENVVQCDGKSINSNDALECIAQIEAVTGPCQ